MMKKRIKQLLLCGLTALITLSAAATTTFATGLTTDGTAPLTKRVRVPASLDIPANTYDFIFSQGPVLNSPMEISPAINNNNSGGAMLNHLSISFAGNEALSGPDADGYYYADLTIADVLADTVFPHADVYTYDVYEMSGSNPINNGMMDYSHAMYRMEVHVVNDGMGGLLTKYVTFMKTINDDGIPMTPIKADMMFVNTYSKDASLEITKKVTGNYADTTKLFDYELTLTTALNVGTSYPATIYSADGSVVNTTIASGSFSNFQLKHGDRMEILNLPVGTSYVLRELASPNYIPTVTSTVNGVVQHSQTESIGNDLIIGMLPNIMVIQDGINTADFINDYPDPTAPTGIIMDNLPFILLILVAVGGFTIYITMKRRKANR